MKKFLSLVLALMLILGCVPLASAEAEPVKLKILRPFHDASLTEEVVAALEEATNTKLEIIPVAFDQWDQKVNTLMSVSEDYDLVMINTTTPWATWAAENLVYDLDTLVDPERHPYTYKLINSDMYAAYAVNGKHYYLPGVHHGQDFVWSVRQDILDDMGVEAITTTDQFLDFARQIKEKYGMYAFVGGSMEGNFEHYQPIFGAFGCGSVHPSERGFIVTEDGTVMESSRTEAAKNALVFLNTMYREGLMNKDYITIGDGYGDMYASADKAFSWYGAYGTLAGMDANLKSINPKAVLSYAEPMNQDTFVGRLGWNAMWTLAFIPATSQNPEAALDLFEYINSKEGRDLLIAGIKGVTCTEDGVTADGVYTPIPEGIAQLWGSETSEPPLWNSFMTTTFGYIPVTEYETFEEAYENRIIYIKSTDLESGSLYNARAGVKYGGMFAETPSVLNTTTLDVEAQVKNTLNTLRAEYWNKIIMEEDPANIDALWNEFVEKWLASGGTEYEAAYQELYNSIK